MRGHSPLVLRAMPRSVQGKQVKHLRKEGLVPASVYRHGAESLHVSVPDADFQRVYRRAGTSGIVALEVEGKPDMRVLFHHVERHPISGRTLHAALLEVRMTEKVTVEVPVRLVGEAPAVKAFRATVFTQRDHLQVEALPAELPSHIDVDLSRLETLDDKVCVSDLTLPAGVTVHAGPDEVVATVVPPAKAEPEAAVEAAAEEAEAGAAPEQGGEKPASE